MKTINIVSAVAVIYVVAAGSWNLSTLANPREQTVDSDMPAVLPRVGHPSLMSPHATPIVAHRNLVFVANTPADTVDVIDAKTREIIGRINVGIDPVSLAIRPDGMEIWVANHVSDSISVIDANPDNPTWLRVIATVQDLDENTQSTRFDEPVGIAFANNEKAYVALSSENQIAVINVASRAVEKRLKIPAQDPRAIVVQGDKLYVIPFESNNKTQLSGGRKKDMDGELVTFNTHDALARSNNVLSLGIVADIVKHPEVPDRDLFIFDTKTDELIQTVDTLGTLLYGLTVDSKGRIFIAQTDARNDANGRAGTKGHGLKELENRPFLNQITKITFKGNRPRRAQFIDLEPLPPQHPEPDNAFATPFAIQISDDDSTLFVSAAGSDKLFTVDSKSGKVLSQASVGAAPRGIALQSKKNGKPWQAWVLNAIANTVSLVDVSDPTNLVTKETIRLEDPTDPVFKKGRIAFNTAATSSTRTASCASCHPDGHTDQLLWVLKTPIVTGGDQIMPRSTMPVRGLRDTAPFHWDGIPGDPYGGNNSANLHGNSEANVDIKIPEAAPRHLIDAGLASTMLLEGDSATNDEGKPGYLSKDERDAMAQFLISIPYPPAPQRAYTNKLSDRAEEGFELFHIVGLMKTRTQRQQVCGNCHRMPFGVSTNTKGSGMDAPTWRGAYDRFLILPQGRSNIISKEGYRRIAEEGNTEKKIWQRSWQNDPSFDPVWDMVLEGSTGFSGAFARQVTLNPSTANLQQTADLLDALEQASREGGIVLQAEGTFIDGDSGTPVALQFEKDGYHEIRGDAPTLTRDELIRLATRGQFVGTFTGRHGEESSLDHPQPALWTLGAIHAQRGQQKFPAIFPGKKAIRLNARHLKEGANVILNGRKVSATISRGERENIQIALQKLPPVGVHFLQVQNPNSLFSNDFIFHVVKNRAQSRKILSAAKSD